MVQKIAIVLAASGLVAVGGLTAAAQELHASTVSTVAQATPAGEAHGDAVSTAAKAQAKDADADKVDTDKTDTDKTTEDSKTSTNTNNAHGNAVSKVAQSDCTAAHQGGSKPVNHGGCVSATAKANH